MRSCVSKVIKVARILPVSVWRRALLRQGVAAGVEHVRVLRGMAGLRTVVDIGGNRGQFALAARHYFPDAKIVSFEPLPEPGAKFRSVFAEDTKATLIDAAIGPISGEALIHVSTRDDSSSMLPITATQAAIFPGTAEIGTSMVRTTRLEQHLPAAEIETPALLKLDVQGFELQALTGCETELSRFAWVYVECSFMELYAGQAFAGEVIAWLRERGFQLHGIYNTRYDRQGRAVQADFAFARGSPSRP
jgi:FkbM family methyltransferase